MDDFKRRRPHLRLVRSDEERERDARVRDSLEGANWRDLFPRLVASAHRMMRKRRPLSDAQDVAQKAITQLLDPDYKDWDPEEKKLEEHLESVAWGIIRNQYVNVGNRSTDALDDAKDRGKRIAASAPSPEDEIASRELHSVVFGELRRHFAAKPLELTIIELFEEGIHLPREQAREIDRAYHVVYEARWRVVREARRIMAELEHSND